MEYKEFLERVIDEGIEAAKADYVKETEKHQLEGSIAGFEACRGLLPDELVDLFVEAGKYVHEAYMKEADNYWYFSSYQAEVEWVCNVVSAMLYNEGKEPLMSYLPTVNGMQKAAKILGVKEY